MRIISVLAAITLISLLGGCSSVDNRITTPESKIGEIGSVPVGVTDRFPDGSPSGGIGMLGLFDLGIDPANVTASLSPIREASLTDVLEVVDITNFLSMAPCADCVKIKSVAMDTDNHLVLSIGIRHPFPPGDPLKPITGRNRADLHVFNVEGILVSDSSGTGFPNSGESISGMGLVNAHGYTGYLDAQLEDFFPTSATIHPYITHFDDYSAGNFDAGNPMGFASVTDPPPSGNLVMAMGCGYDYKDYIFNIDDEMNFILAVGCTYAVSAASKSARFNPEYRVPQHNKKAASEVSVSIITNELEDSDTLSTAEIEIRVVDISHNVAVSGALDEMLSDSSVDSIYLDIPGILNTMKIIDGGSPISGTGHDPSDPLVYSIMIQNEAAALEGDYSGLVKVLDSYSHGQNASPLLNGMDGIKRVDPTVNPLQGLFDIPEFTTYQTFKIDVAEATVSLGPPENPMIVVNRVSQSEKYRINEAGPFTITWTAPSSGDPPQSYAIYVDRDPSDGYDNNYMFLAEVLYPGTSWTGDGAEFMAVDRYIEGWTYMLRSRAIAGDPLSESVNSDQAHVITASFETAPGGTVGPPGLFTTLQGTEGWWANQERVFGSVTRYTTYAYNSNCSSNSITSYGCGYVRLDLGIGLNTTNNPGNWMGMQRETPTPANMQNISVRRLDFVTVSRGHYNFGSESGGLIIGTCPTLPSDEWLNPEIFNWAQAHSTSPWDAYQPLNQAFVYATFDVSPYTDVPTTGPNAWYYFTAGSTWDYNDKRLRGGDVNLFGDPDDPYVGIQSCLSGYDASLRPETCLDEISIAIY